MPSLLLRNLQDFLRRRAYLPRDWVIDHSFILDGLVGRLGQELCRVEHPDREHVTLHLINRDLLRMLKSDQETHLLGIETFDLPSEAHHGLPLLVSGRDFNLEHSTIQVGDICRDEKGLREVDRDSALLTEFFYLHCRRVSCGFLRHDEVYSLFEIILQ